MHIPNTIIHNYAFWGAKVEDPYQDYVRDRSVFISGGGGGEDLTFSAA